MINAGDSSPSALLGIMLPSLFATRKGKKDCEDIAGA